MDCLECHDYCSDCLKYDSCRSCADGYYLQEGKCFACDSSCKTCSNGNEYSCSACRDSYIFDIKSGKCLSNEKGFYEDFCDIQADSLICCKEICGDGLLFTLQCDDKNIFDGDGCSSNCSIESNFFCYYNDTNRLSICHYIAPLTANLSLPNSSATFTRIEFNEPIINWNKSLTQYIDIYISAYVLLKKDNFYTYNLTFINNHTIDIIIQYNKSFKSAELVVKFVNSSAFLNEMSQMLITKSLYITLPNYNYYSPETENLLKETTKVSESSQTITSVVISFLTVTNLNAIIVGLLLSSLQMMFYFNLIKIKYPRNFVNLVKGGTIFTSSLISLPNYFLMYVRKNNYLKDLNNIFQDNEMTSYFLIDNESIILSIIQLIIMHGLLSIIISVTGYKSIAINKNSYYQNILAKSGYIILACLLSIFHLDCTNWLTKLSYLISYYILIFLIIWIIWNIKKLIDLEKHDELDLLIFPAYLNTYQIFGFFDLLKETIFALSLIIFEYYPIVNVSFFLATQLFWIILLIKYKPTNNNNNIFIFSESGNLLILLICLLWAIDDKANFLTEDDRSIIGWLGISIVSFVFIVNLLSGFVIIIEANKNKIKKLWEKCQKRRSNQS